MAKFKGFNDYVEIFRGGLQVDSKGTEHDGNGLIEKAIASFNSARHEPPLVVGHPKDNAPAFGWVESLKIKVADGGNILLAKFKDVAPEFEELVKAGLYKKRSASFYPDGRLRHVGFLGAVPPAVKGLADIAFDEGEPLTFDFYDYQKNIIARLFARIREYLIEKEGVETADRVVSSWEVDDLKEASPLPEAEPINNYKEHNVKTFTEADIEAARKQAKEEALAEAAASFAEEQKKQKQEAAKAAIATFCQTPIANGGPTPAMLDAGLRQFMEGLDSSGAINFSDQEGAEEKTPLQWMMEFTGDMAKKTSPDFSEHAKEGEEIERNMTPETVAKKAIEFRESEAAAGRTITITEAVGWVRKNSQVED